MNLCTVYYYYYYVNNVKVTAISNEVIPGLKVMFRGKCLLPTETGLSLSKYGIKVGAYPEIKVT